jgi:pyridoxamine 5'-phosphate oxidase
MIEQAPIPDYADPFPLFDRWYEDAAATEPADPNAMSLATIGADGMPSVRVVLMKAVERGGFVFYTNMESRKGQQLAATPRAALCFHWKGIRRQVRIEGLVEPVSAAEADTYFATRPRGSQVGAWASQQSRSLASREDLEQRVREMEAKYPTAVPRPPHWSGYRVMPLLMEFWQDMPYRLHDRVIYRRPAVAAAWTVERWYP